MNPSDNHLSERATELRQAFDRSFAEPILADERKVVDFITLRIAGDPYAVRMADVAGLFNNVKITPVPGPLREMRGIAGFRGTLTPVYDLAALLGYPPSSACWIVLANAGALGLAFDAFEGHFRIDPSAIAVQQNASAPQHVREIASHAGAAWPVVDIPSVVAAIRKRLPQTATSKE